jgi:hypothetical protein
MAASGKIAKGNLSLLKANQALLSLPKRKKRQPVPNPLPHEGNFPTDAWGMPHVLDEALGP